MQELAAVFLGHEFEGIADHVHDADLHFRLGENRLDCFGKTLQTIHAGDEYVLDAAALNLAYYFEPEPRTFTQMASK